MKIEKVINNGFAVSRQDLVVMCWNVIQYQYNSEWRAELATTSGPGPACLAAAAGGNCTLQKMVIKTTSLKGLMVEVDLCFKRILVE